MSTLEHEHGSGEQNTMSAERALEQKRGALEAALKDAPQGRHTLERSALDAAHEQLAGRCEAAVREAVDAFFAQQRDQLGLTQQAELDIINAALDSSNTEDLSLDAQRDALQMLEREAGAAGAIHRDAHARLAQERADLDAALAAGTREQQHELIADLRDRQQQADTTLRDTIDAARAFAEGAGLTVQATETADNPERHKRGNFGERAAAEALAAQGYDILNYKPEIEGTTRPGIDLVAMKDDTVYLVDNKALSRDGNVRSVSALTDNLEDNLSQVKRELQDMVSDAARTEEEIAVARKALDALEEGRYALAVTNANVTRDNRILEDVSERLKLEHDITFLDVMKGNKP